MKSQKETSWTSKQEVFLERFFEANLKTAENSFAQNSIRPSKLSKIRKTKNLHHQLEKFEFLIFNLIFMIVNS